MRHIQRIGKPVYRQIQNIWHWYVRLRHRQVWLWRSLNAFIVVILLFGIVWPVLSHFITNKRYVLSPEAKQLVGSTDPKLTDQLTWDEQAQAWQFNAQGLNNTANLPGGAGAARAVAAMRSQVGASSGKNGDTSTYAVTLPQDLSKGVTYTDTNTGLSFSLIPKFDSMPGRLVDGHLVYPLDDGNQAIYTLKGNGLKEDIYIANPRQYHGHNLNLSYSVKLPTTLEVKQIPDGNGALGIYSADPTLFAANADSSQDKAALERARQQGDKTNLVFGLPSPTITTLSGHQPGEADGRFELTHSNRLAVIAEDLSHLDAPVSLDPSVVVTSASDFQTSGNNEGMIAFDSTNNQITRSGLTGGSVGSWSTSDTGTACHGNRSVTYNGYLYSLGGWSCDQRVAYAAVNSNGSVGTWASTTNLPTDITYHGAAAYSGYMYIFGGADEAGTFNTAVFYAPIKSDGTLGSWQTNATNMPVNRSSFAYAIYNDYLYVMGGWDGSSVHNEVYYASIRADGSVGTWTATTSFTTARSSNSGFAYNGYLYVMGGYNASSTYYSDTQYAKINSDGTIGSWTATTSFTTGRASPAVTVYNGYAYVMGGTANVSTPLSDTQYAQINANGSLGTWRTATNLSIAVWNAAPTAYNGYLYVLNGATTTSTDTSFVQYAKIDPAGQPTTFAATATNFSTARNGICAVAYNGYLYAIGGSTYPLGTYYAVDAVTTVGYTPLNATTGQTGTWSTTTALPEGRAWSACGAANGYLYVLGGYGGGSSILQTARYIAISTSGTLSGSWSSTSTMPDYMPNAAVSVYNNVLYAVGNASNNTTQAVDWSTLNASTGAFGTWHAHSGNSFAPSAYNHRGHAIIGNHAYALGGDDGSAAQTLVEYATLDPAGENSTWTATASLPTAISEPSVTAVNGCLYVFGGSDLTNTKTTVQYACPSADGSITTWYSAANLPAGEMDMGATNYHGFIYGVGGYTTSVQNTTLFATVNNGGGGNGGGWVITTSSEPSVTRAEHATVVYNGCIYLLAGVVRTTSAALTNIDYAALNADGSYGTWQNDTTHPVPVTSGYAREYASAVAYNGYLYVGGGFYNNSGYVTPYQDIWYAPLATTGCGLAGNWTQTSSFDNPGVQTALAAYNGHMYVVGGVGGTGGPATTSAVELARINADGSLGAFGETIAMQAARIGAGAVAYGGYLYAISGNTGNNSIEYAPIGSDGTLGNWSYTNVNGDTDAETVAAYDGFLYVMGYDGSHTASCAVQYAPILNNGGLGTWQQASVEVSGDPCNGRSSSAQTAYNGYMYVASGGTDTSGNDYGWSYQLNSIARSGHYSKLINFGAATNITSVTYHGTLPGGTQAITYRIAGGDGVFGNTLSAVTAPSAGSCSVQSNTAFYILLNVTLDDSSGQGNGGGLADGTGNANLTDITVNYHPVHPPPNIRLRGGQTLQAGSLSAFDTCNDGYTDDSAPGGGGGGTTPPSVASVGTDKGTGAANVPSGVASGSLVLLAVGGEWNTSTAATCSAVTATGFTCAQVANNIVGSWQESTFLLYKYATGSDTGSYSVTFNKVGGKSVDERGVVALRITGGPTSGNPFVDTFHSATGASTTTATVSSFTPTADGSLLIASFWADDITSGTTTIPGGWTKRNTAYGDDGLLTAADTGQTTAAATGTLTFTAPSAIDPVVLIGTIRP